MAKKRKLSNEELQTKESGKINLKLLVDSMKNKVLFAEAGKDFVDFIFHTMSLPLGTVVELLNQKNMVGCLGDLYKSVKSLNTQYFAEGDHSKKSVLKPITAVKVPLLSLNNEASAVKFYRCGSGKCTCHSITYIEGTLCPNCHKGMNKEVRFVEPTASEAKPQPQPSSSNGGNEGYVKGVVTYMVMDNLEVQPMSTISGITMMNKFGIKDVASLVEVNVLVGLKEGKAILKASLETKSVLTSVFIGKKI